MLRLLARAGLAAAALFAFLIAPAPAADPAVIRIEVMPPAQKDAANIALQGGSVNLIVRAGSGSR